MSNIRGPDEWTGEERRSIPIHVLNYIKEVVVEETRELKSSFEKYQKDFAEHDAGEMARYDAILANQIKNSQESAERHHALVDSITVNLGRIEQTETAFIRDHNGNADYHGHREAHVAWIAESTSRKEFWTKMKFELTKWGLVGFLGWLLIQVWTSLLHGPQQ